MRSRFIYFISLSLGTIFSSIAQTAPLDGSTTLTLDDCLKIALAKSPTVKIADMEIQRMDYSKKELLGQLLPSLSFGGTYNRMVAKQVAYMNMSKFGALAGGGASAGSAEGSEPTEDTPAPEAPKGNSGIKMGLDNSFQLGFSAGIPLIAPQLWKSLKLSDSQILQTVEQARASRLDLVNAVKSAYFTLLLANDSKKVIQESYNMASLTHDIYSKKHSAGAASDYDVLRTSVAMKNIEPELLQADVAIKQARLQLMILMGVDTTLPLNFAGQLSDYESTMYDRAMSLSSDYSKNSSLVLNTLQTNTLKDALTVQKMAWYPTLSLSGTYFWTSSSDGSPFKNFRWDPYSVVSLSLSFPLFEGGQRYHRIKQAQVQLDEMRWARENLERSVSMQTALAIDNINTNIKSIATASENVKLAERAHNIMQSSFDIGAATYLDLRDSELSLTQSRLGYYQSIYNLLVAESSLELLLGNAPLDKYETPNTQNK